MFQPEPLHLFEPVLQKEADLMDIWLPHQIANHQCKAYQDLGDTHRPREIADTVVAQPVEMRPPAGQSVNGWPSDPMEATDHQTHMT